MDESGNKHIGLQESLQPQSLSENDRAYRSVLDIEERLRKKDATNIALTGPYGSGKSSILITLRSKYPDYKYLNISLATLKPSETISLSQDDSEDGSDTNNVSKLNLDRLIEYSILQQLMYKEKQETLPNSRFKRIFHLPDNKIRWITVGILLAVLSLIVVFEPSFLHVEWLCQLFGKRWLNIAGDILGIGYLCFFSYVTVSKIVPAVSNSRLNKFNIKDGEIEIVENTSIFNKHLDEILYFFERTPYNVIILEDLDRFETADIFVKLRELNLLLNESKVVGRKIFFIYAVRDDMFQDKERVKCFDYITTVIPIINRSNAKSQLKEELAKRGVTDIADNYLQELGFFLHDMRLLKNIANEYVQYRGKLQAGISSSKLLGMIVYKNYYPQDFALLHDCKGKVYQLLNLKEKFIANRIQDLERENLRRQELKRAHQKEKVLKETELRRIYIDAYRDKCGDNVLQFKVGDSFYSLKDIASDERLFQKFISNSNITYSYICTSNGYYSNAGRTLNSTLNISFVEIENSVDESENYAERLEALNFSFAEMEESDFVDIRKDDIRSQTLSKIMGEMDYASNEDYLSLNVPRLIEYLVVKGYIDENYYDYISYFYDNFIDAHDWEFVLDLKLNKPHSYDYIINNAEACIKEIPHPVFHTNAILNIYILDYLAEHCSDRMNMVRLKVVLKTAIEGRKYDFFAAYYQKGRQQDIVFTQLYAHHKDLWNVFDKNDDEKHSLKLSWFKYAEENQGCDASNNWLSLHYEFVVDNLMDIDEDRWISLISEKRYKFKELKNNSSKVLKAIVEKDAYILNRYNLLVILSDMVNIQLDSLSYRLVLQTEHDTLINRVNKNLDRCLKTIFSVPEAEKENEVAILGILKSEVVAEEDKIDYLGKQQNKIDLNIMEEHPEKTLALRCDVVEPTWDNVIHYMNVVGEKKTDNDLVVFINNHSEELSLSPVPRNPEDDERMLLRQLVKTESLTFTAYRSIVNQFTRWQLTGVPMIEERRISVLIDKGMIRFKEENTKDITEHFSDRLFVEYLLKNKHEFLKGADSIEYSTEVALGLMKSDMSVREKASIIPNFESDILNDVLADKILSILAKYEINLDTGFLLKVVSLSELFAEKLKVIIYTLEKNTLSEETITAFIESLPEPYKFMAEKGKKPELPDNVDSRKLIMILKELEYISSYSDSKNGIRVNTKLK